MPLSLKNVINRIGTKFLTWSIESGVTIIKEIPRFIWLKVEAPVNAGELSPSFGSGFVKAKSIPPRRLCLLNNVFISRRGEIFRDRKIFLPSLAGVGRFDTWKALRLLLSRRLSSRIRSVPEIVTVVHDEYSLSNYYHWMVEALPRLFYVNAVYPECALILPDRPSKFITETVNAFEITNIIYLSHNDIISAKRLAFAELVYYDGVANDEAPADLKFLGNDLFRDELIVNVTKKLRDHFGCDNATKPFRKIYVSRSKQNLRKLLNETDLLQVLKKYDIEVYHFEDLTLEEQIKLVNETCLYIGVHGANMVNTMFLRPGSKVVELMNQDYVNDAYYLLASSLAVAYYSVPCKMFHQRSKDHASDGFDFELNGADLIVDLSFIEQTIRMCIHSETNIEEFPN